jgi:hypothetical protein
VCVRIRTNVYTGSTHVPQLSDWKRAHMCTENHVYVRTYNVMSQLVRTYVQLYVRTVPPYDACVRTNIISKTTRNTSTQVQRGTLVDVQTLSRKRLETQALRCNGETRERCQYVHVYVPLVPCYHGTFTTMVLSTRVRTLVVPWYTYIMVGWSYHGTRTYVVT